MIVFELMTFIKVWSWVLAIVTGTILYKEEVRGDIELPMWASIVNILVFGATLFMIII